MLRRVPASLRALLVRTRVHWPAGTSGGQAEGGFNGILPDGMMLVTTMSANGHGLGLLRPGSDRIVPLYSYRHRNDGTFVQEVAETDGYVIFRVGVFGGDFPTRWWMVEVNLRTRRSWVIGRANPGIAQELMAITPSAGDGYVAWTQSRPDRSLEVHVVDVRTRVNRLVPWRDIAFPEIADGRLLLVDNPSGDWQSPQGYSLVALDLHTLQRVPLPAGLGQVENPRVLSVTPAGTLWNTEDFQTIEAQAATRPGALLQATNTYLEDWPYLSDNGFAGWYQNGGPGSGVLADIRTGVAVSIANHVYIAGDTVVTETFPGGNIDLVSVFSTADLPRLTGCRPTVLQWNVQPPSPAPALVPLSPSVS